MTAAHQMYWGLVERIAEMSEKATEYDIGDAEGLPPAIHMMPGTHLSVGGSEWLKLPSGQYVNMARVEWVKLLPETHDPQDEHPNPPGMIVDMGHRSALLRGEDIAAVLAYLDGVVIS